MKKYFVAYRQFVADKPFRDMVVSAESESAAMVLAEQKLREQEPDFIVLHIEEEE